MSIPLQEKVYAKSASLKNAETLLDELITNFNSETIDVKRGNEIQQEVASILEKHFGFYHLNFNSGHVLTGGTGFIMPTAVTTGALGFGGLNKTFSLETPYNATSTGYKWKPAFAPITSIAVSPGLLSTNGLKGDHLLAIILHEIGHSFYFGTALARTTRLFFWIGNTLIDLLSNLESFIIKLGLDVVSNTFFNGFLNFIYSLLKFLVNDLAGMFLTGFNKTKINRVMEDVFGKSAAKTITGVGAITHSAATSAMYLAMTATIFGATFVKNSSLGILKLIAMDGLTEERFADEFAASMGYGAALAEGLNLLTTKGNAELDANKERTAMNAAINTLAVVESQLSVLVSFADPHPDVYSRGYYLADFYKGAIKSAKTSKERKFLENELATILRTTPQYAIASLNGKSNADELIAKYKQDKLVKSDRYSYFDRFKDFMFGSDNTLLASMIKDGKIDSVNEQSLESIMEDPEFIKLCERFEAGLVKGENFISEYKKS